MFSLKFKRIAQILDKGIIRHKAAMETRHKDIGTKTRCFRQSKRHDLLTGQWEQKRFKQHRDRITNAEPRIDVKTPISDSFQHVKVY